MMIWLLAMLVIGLAAWALAEVLLYHPVRNGARHQDLYCAYCGWGLSRTAGYEVYRWEGKVFCSLVCLRQDDALQERERDLE
jgi:hypothetical protein